MKKLMTTQINLLKSKLGFTLVELMVVIAIIGILASIAVPQYGKFQSKARQSEAKVNLGGVLTAEQAFFAENGFFTACLNNIGYTPGGSSASRYYAVGFGDAAGNDNRLTPSINCTLGEDNSFYSAGKGIGAAAANSVNATDASAGNFNAEARGSISTTSAYDVWHTDQAGALVNTTPNL